MRTIHKIIFSHRTELHSTILDIGCGSGEAVDELLKHGFNAYGVDIKFKPGTNLENLLKQNRVRKIKDDLLLPFASDSFDVVYADQVL